MRGLRFFLDARKHRNPVSFPLIRFAACSASSIFWGRIFIVLCFISFVKCSAVPASFRHPSRSISAPIPHPQSNALLQGWRRALLYCFLFMHIRKARAAVYDVCRPMCTARYSIRAHRSIGPRPSRTTPRFCASTQTSKSITALARPITGRG